MTFPPRHALVWLVGLALIGQSQNAGAIEPGETDFEAGQQVSILFDGRVTRNLTYVGFHTKPILARNDQTGSTWEMRLGARAFYDFETKTTEVAIRDLSLLRRTEHITATLGFQEIPWGETLGFPVADIVNPRDLRDPLFLDVDFVRLPVLAANVQYTGGPFRAQAILTPFPRAPLLPETGSPFLPSSTLPLLPPPNYSVDRAGQDAEGGGRLGYIAGGWDFSALFLSHWNRVPVYEVVPLGTTGSFALQPVFDRVETAGLSLTKPIGDRFVLRADSVLNFDEPRQSTTLAPPDRVLESQTVAEGDLTLDNDWVFSLQYEYDRQGGLDRMWASGRVQKALFRQRLNLALFGFKGVGNGDAWLEPQVAWSFLDVFSLEARADLLWGTVGDAGLLGYFDGKNRAFAILRVKL